MEGLRVSYERPGKVAGLYLSWYRCAVDGRDHAVTDEQFLTGMRARQGRYGAVCGHVVNVMSALCAPGAPCIRCHSFLAAHASVKGVADRAPKHRHSRPGLWRRLFARPCTPASVGRTKVPTGAGSASIAPVPAGDHGLRGVQ